MKIILYTCGLILHDIAYNIAETEKEYKSDFTLAKVFPYLALTNEPWDVYCKIR